MDIFLYGHFLKPTDSILFKQCDKSSPFNFTQYSVLPHNIEIVMWPQIAVTSLHPMYNDFQDKENHQQQVLEWHAS